MVCGINAPEEQMRHILRDFLNQVWEKISAIPTIIFIALKGLKYYFFP